MPSRTLIVTNPHGLQAQSAVVFVQAALQHPAPVRLHKADRVADGKSVLGVLTLGVKCQDVVTLEVVNGSDAVLAKLGQLLGSTNAPPGGAARATARD